MIFDTSIKGLGYAPDYEDEEDITDDYPNEDRDMDRYYEEKYKDEY